MGRGSNVGGSRPKGVKKFTEEDRVRQEIVMEHLRQHFDKMQNTEQSHNDQIPQGYEEPAEATATAVDSGTWPHDDM